MRIIYNSVVAMIGTRRAIALGQAYWHAINCIRYGSPYFFHDVAIEISNHCNRSCWYCPQSLTKFPVRLMSDEVFGAVIQRLRQIRFNGQINYSIFNEPLLDSRLTEFIRDTKRFLPTCKIIINTNGDRLTTDMAARLFECGVTKIIVTDHPPHNDNWKSKIDKVAKRWPLSIRVQRLERYKNVAGLIPGIAEGPFTNPCTSPCDVLVIRFDGDIGICCCDYYRTVSIGNITLDDIGHIWFSEKATKIRTDLRKGIRTLPICQNCNGGYIP